MNYREIVRYQQEYWQKLAAKYAGSVYAVGSESKEHKQLRYRKILQMLDGANDFTIHEIGPGIGDLNEYLLTNFVGYNYVYSASEITQEYCKIMSKRYPDINVYCRDILSEDVEDNYDYIVLSGVFHQSKRTIVPTSTTFNPHGIL